MPLIGLQIKAQFENVTNLRPSFDDYILSCHIKCTSCQETQPKLVGIVPGPKTTLSSGRGEAHFVMSCALCRRELSASFEDITPTKPRWRPVASKDDKNDFQTLVILDVRGMDILDFDFDGEWKCESTESKEIFQKFEFEDNEWTDYDEKAAVSVGITELESRWVRV